MTIGLRYLTSVAKTHLINDTNTKVNIIDLKDNSKGNCKNKSAKNSISKKCLSQFFFMFSQQMLPGKNDNL